MNNKVETIRIIIIINTFAFNEEKQACISITPRVVAGTGTALWGLYIYSKQEIR